MSHLPSFSSTVHARVTAFTSVPLTCLRGEKGLPVAEKEAVHSRRPAAGSGGRTEKTLTEEQRRWGGTWELRGNKGGARGGTGVRVNS